MLRRRRQVSGRWTEKSSGGNHSLPTFMNNPQYRLELTPPPSTSSDAFVDLVVSVETEKEVPINVKLVRMHGERVFELVVACVPVTFGWLTDERDSLEERDVVAGTATYCYGRDSLHVDDLRSPFSPSLSILQGTDMTIFSSGTVHHCCIFFRGWDRGHFFRRRPKFCSAQSLPDTTRRSRSLCSDAARCMVSSFLLLTGRIRLTRSFLADRTEGTDGGSADLTRNPRFVISPVKQTTEVKFVCSHSPLSIQD
jgi:hypothetical protein